MSKKNKRMLEKKAERVAAAREERREKRTFVKALGITLCLSAIIVLVGVLVITDDYRGQKAVLDRYISAVDTGDVQGIKACYGTNFDDPDFYLTQDGIERGIELIKEEYGEDYGAKYEIVSRFDYTDMIFNAGDTEYVLYDLDITLYNDERSDTEAYVAILMKEPDGRWQLHEGCFELGGMDIIKDEE